MQPLIIQYTNLLHQYRDPQAPAVKEFRENHGKKDPVFRKRAETLDKVFQLKQELVKKA